MAESKAKSATEPQDAGRRKIVVGEVVSSRMHKTIVVQVVRKKAHPFYGRVVSKAKKFYAHDEQSTAKLGDVVRIIECPPVSHLKRWKLGEVIRRAAQVAVQPSDLDVKV